MKFIYLLLIFLCVSLLSYSNNLVKYTFGIEDGLPSNCIYSTFKDSHNRIWICTDKGISMFNGISFKNFDIQDGLSDMDVFSACEDKAGRVWFSPFNGKPFYFENNTFKTLANISNTDNRYTVQYILSSKGFPIIGIGNKLYYKINDQANYKSIEIKSSSTEYTQNLLKGRQLNEDEFILYLWHGIAIFNIRQESIKFLKDDKNIWFVNIREYGDSIYTLEQDRLILYNDQSPKTSLKLVDVNFVSNRIDNHFIYATHSGSVYELYIDGSQKLISTGIYRINHIQKDNIGGYWISSLTEGLIYINNNIIDIEPSFNCRTISTDSSFFYLSNKILKNSINNKIFEFPIHYQINRIEKLANDLYLATNYGILKLNLITKSLENIYSASVKSILIIDNYIYLGTSNSLIKYNIKSKQLELIKEIRITSICKNNEHSFYFSTPTALYEFDIAKNCMTMIREDFFGSIMKIEKRNHLILINTNGGGIKILDTLTKKDILINNQLNEKFDLYNNYLLENDSTIWLVKNNEILKIIFNINLKTATLAYNINLNKDYVLNSMAIKDSFLLLAADKGLIKINKNLFAKNQYLYTITDMHSNKPYEIVDHKIYLSPDNINTIINFSLLNDVTPFLLNIDFTLDNRSIKLVNGRLELNYLKPGYHTLLLTIKQLDKNIYVSYTIIVKPYFYERLLFKCILSILIISTFIGTIYFLRKYYRKRELRYIEYYETKQKSLLNQINPHFIYNSLNAINSFLLENDIQKANSFLVKYSKLMRYFTSNSPRSSISLEEELSYLTNYVELEKLRFPDKFEFKIISNNIDLTTIYISNMLLQPIVENAIKHGIIPSTVYGEITIELNMFKEYVHLTITDNGVGGLTEEILNRDISNALSITKNRLKNYQEMGFKDAGIFLVKEYTNGTRLLIKTPSLHYEKSNNNRR